MSREPQPGPGSVSGGNTSVFLMRESGLRFSRSRVQQDVQGYENACSTRVFTLFNRVDECITIRSPIEGVFKAVKSTFSLKRLLRYTTRPVEKVVVASVWALAQKTFYNTLLNGNFVGG